MTDHPCRLPPPLIEGQPAARALVRGDAAHPELMGEVLFYDYQDGTLLLARMAGLPGDGFFGFHIHESGDCCTGGDIPFHCAGPHYDIGGHTHPSHTGDLPALLSDGGRAYMVVYTGRFRPSEVMGRSVMVHAGPDDYHSQPAGDSGARIACGPIEPMND